MYPIIEIDKTQYVADYERKIYFRNEGDVGYTPLPEDRIPKRVKERLDKISTDTIEEFFWRGATAV